MRAFSIEQAATSRLLEYLHREYRYGCRVFPLMELSGVTAIDPGTVESVMEQLEAIGPFDVEPLDQGEIRWRVEASVYDLDGWDCTDWNLD